MKVRTQLIVAFLLLAVLPLAGIVLFSYWTSQSSFRRAVEAESRLLGEQMGERLDAVRAELDARLQSVGQLPVRALLPSAEEGPSASQVYAGLMAQMGEMAELVEWLEFQPLVEDEGNRGFFIYPSTVLARALGRLQRREATLEESGITREYLEETIRQAIFQRERFQAAELQGVEARGEEMRELLGSELTAPVMRGDEVIGTIRALVPPSEIVRLVLERTPREGGELAYARDADGKLYLGEGTDRQLLERLAPADGAPEGGTASAGQEWIVVETPDPESGLRFGVARPVGDSLRDFQRTAAWNFGAGLALMAVALVGVVWVSGRMTRKLAQLAVAAHRLAAGDLTTRVAVRSRDEFGELARAFNHMARDLADNQRRLIEEERRRREQELTQRLLEAENERKSRELEEARRLQLSLLPKTLPRHPELEVAVFMRTATEVGGDYYDFFPGPDGSLTTVIGDAAGHGAQAGTMVSVVKGLFTAGAAEADLAHLLESATRAIRQMELGRMNMAASLVRIGSGAITVAAAGMPPVLLHRRREARVEEVLLAGTPLGSMARASYREWRSRLGDGDTVLLMSDGFPELPNDEGEPLGYARVTEIFLGAAEAEPQEILRRLADAARGWAGDRPPADDVTFVVLRATGGAA
ncbi:MAG: SpoIIE family protein phosphatase [Thermoanaerobaculia bacterium]|nr:SpoIIE family protein phosphatase [Thermoanaerobaculia bacterium]